VHVVADRDQDVHERARRHTAEVPVLVEQDYGSTELTVTDPDPNG